MKLGLLKDIAPEPPAEAPAAGELKPKRAASRPTSSKMPCRKACLVTSELLQPAGFWRNALQRNGGAAGNPFCRCVE
jgi:hypothetical protein